MEALTIAPPEKKEQQFAYEKNREDIPKKKGKLPNVEFSPIDTEKTHPQTNPLCKSRILPTKKASRNFPGRKPSHQMWNFHLPTPKNSFQNTPDRAKDEICPPKNREDNFQNERQPAQYGISAYRPPKLVRELTRCAKAEFCPRKNSEETFQEESLPTKCGIFAYRHPKLIRELIRCAKAEFCPRKKRVLKILLIS